MSKTKTIPLEVPADLKYDRATIAVLPGHFCKQAIVDFHSTPTWTWCENPTDEMALLRPDCEARNHDCAEWVRRGVLMGVRPEHAIGLKYSTSESAFISCRVRLDSEGKVIVRWGDE